jgi:hypothetical protein
MSVAADATVAHDQFDALGVRDAYFLAASTIVAVGEGECDRGAPVARQQDVEDARDDHRVVALISRVEPEPQAQRVARCNRLSLVEGDDRHAPGEPDEQPANFAAADRDDGPEPVDWVECGERIHAHAYRRAVACA